MAELLCIKHINIVLHFVLYVKGRDEERNSNEESIMNVRFLDQELIFFTSHDKNKNTNFLVI